MNLHTYSFQDLSTQQVYDILQLRAEVFVVEQDCVYQDVDDKDQKALHVLGYDSQEKLIAYTRCFAPGEYFEQASIGRVVVRKDQRSEGYGYDLMKYSIAQIQSNFYTTTIKISAQTYLHQFYTSLGFIPIGKEYLEDGIPHIAMIYSDNS
ncbi:GNAT family N-acetyltransferase [Gangjinia marincola]|uniref:GNAT family N-acetyltransferase n=1 Tax=Gangjinia marincola TaxID=578463 RepID=A0ABP3XU63_9FLAO